MPQGVKVRFLSSVHNYGMEKLTILRNRLAEIGISIEFASNVPWIYIYKINGKRVTEIFEADHGFTVGFLPVSSDKPFHFTDLSTIFKLIRKYAS